MRMRSRPPLRAQRRSRSQIQSNSIKPMSTRSDWIDKTVSSNEWTFEFPIPPPMPESSFPCLSIEFPNEAFSDEDEPIELAYDFSSPVAPEEFLHQLQHQTYI